MHTGMLTKLTLRELRQNRQQTTVLFLCIVLSVMGLTASGRFSGQCPSGHAARCPTSCMPPMSSCAPVFLFCPQWKTNWQAFTSQTDVSLARVWEFYTVVRTASESASLLSAVKVVEPGYPFYGQVALASGRPSTMFFPGGHRGRTDLARSAGFDDRQSPVPG